tara:strand:+ start:21 stop:764 length:744 start_codon:yes stop_codon:yes gene_type:complete
MKKFPEIQVSNLSKTINKKTILSNISFNLEPENHLVIIGGSGAGKTMLLKCILGLESLSKGKIYSRGNKVENKKEISQFLSTIGVCFQGNALFDSYKVWENISFEKIHAKQNIDRKSARDLAVTKLLEVGLSAENADLFPSELSGGMQKRVGIARAIFSSPDILFFDEPTTGLDPIMSRKIIALIKKIMDNSKKSAITITHDINLALSLASEILLLNEGKVEWSGSKYQIVTAKTQLIKEFLKGTTK